MTPWVIVVVLDQSSLLLLRAAKDSTAAAAAVPSWRPQRTASRGDMRAGSGARTMRLLHRRRQRPRVFKGRFFASHTTTTTTTTTPSSVAVVVAALNSNIVLARTSNQSSLGHALDLSERRVGSSQTSFSTRSLLNPLSIGSFVRQVSEFVRAMWGECRSLPEDVGML
jgi:hypothetical protein